MVVELVSPHATPIPESTPIYDELVAELTAKLAGQGFWPDYFTAWVVDDVLFGLAVRSAVDTLCDVLGVPRVAYGR